MNYPTNQLRDGHGGLIPFPPFITQEDLDALAAQFRMQTGDAFIVTYPRSGTTWTEQIVHLLLNEGEQGDAKLTDAVPWFETLPKRPGGISGFLEKLAAHPNPRGMRPFTSHLPFVLMPDIRKNGGKVVYVARNPKDVAVSYYFHDCSKHGFAATWNDHFRLFMDGRLHYGSYFDHVIPWWQESKRRQDILFVKYEDMKADIEETIHRIAKFLGLSIDKNLLNLVLEGSSFSHMANSEQTNFQWLSQRKNVPGHYRTGKTGGWREHFSKEQNERLDALYMEKMTGTGLRFDFGEGLILP